MCLLFNILCSVDYSNMTGDAASSNVASCFVRVGNTLLYPYINSFGWSATGYEYPTPCKNSTVLSNPAAKYFCSKCLSASVFLGSNHCV